MIFYFFLLVLLHDHTETAIINKYYDKSSLVDSDRWSHGRFDVEWSHILPVLL